MGKIFGQREDGTLERCRAKPENRGKGRCPHGKHVSVPLSHIRSGIIERFNEEQLHKNFSSLLPSHTRESTSISSPYSGVRLTREEFIESAHALAETMSTQDYEFFAQFSRIYEERIHNRELAQRYTNTVANIESFLKGSSKTAQRIRSFLGKDINLHDFSEICVAEVSSMTSKAQWKPRGGNSVSRVVLTNVVNDMNKQRYLASVLYFGGRCCYCGVPLRKRPPRDKQASGEHLTPLNPTKPHAIHGATRFGNMALACQKCNNLRGNNDLVDFVMSSPTIHDSQRLECLARIESFRRFALYEEFTREENARITQTIVTINKSINKLRLPDGLIPEESIPQARSIIKENIFDLREKL